MNQNLGLAPSSGLLTALSTLSCDCLCGVEAEFTLAALLSASAASALMKWFSLRPPAAVNGSTGPARLQVGVLSSPPGFSNTWLSGNKLATKSFFSHFRPSCWQESGRCPLLRWGQDVSISPWGLAHTPHKAQRHF